MDQIKPVPLYLGACRSTKPYWGSACVRQITCMASLRGHMQSCVTTRPLERGHADPGCESFDKAQYNSEERENVQLCLLKWRDDRMTQDAYKRTYGYLTIALLWPQGLRREIGSTLFWFEARLLSVFQRSRVQRISANCFHPPGKVRHESGNRCLKGN